MYKDYKIIPCVPAGRRERMSILINYLLKYKDNPIDEVYLWRNTKDEEDLKYIDSFEGDYFKVFDILKEPNEVFNEPKQLNTGKYYRYTLDPQTIYIRFDDDIVYVDDDYFKNMLEFRINNPHYFLVFGNIWNNSIVSFIHQKEGRMGHEAGTVRQQHCMDEVGWRSPQFAEYIHKILLQKIKEGKTSDLFFDRWDLSVGERFSISNFSYFGKDFQEFGKEVRLPVDYARRNGYYELDEEIFLCIYYPQLKNKTSTICGSALVSHFSFMFQRDHLLKNTDILEQYRKISLDKLSKSYYNFLNENTNNRQ